MLHDSIYMKFQKKQNESVMTEDSSGCLGLRWEIASKGTQRNSLGDGMFCIMTVGMVMRVYVFIKTHSNVHLKWKHFIVHKFISITLVSKQQLKTASTRNTWP